MISGYEGDERLPGYEPLEGEYTQWLYVWDYDAVALGLTLDGVIVNNEGEVYTWDSLNAPLLHIDFAGNVTQFANVEEWAFQVIQANSIDSKYVVGIDRVVTTIFHVIRRGADIFNRDITLDGVGANRIAWRAISPNGRHIVTISRDAGTGNYTHVTLYTGQ